LAYKWLLIARAGGDENSLKPMAIFGARLSAEELQQAQEQAAEWRTKHRSKDEAVRMAMQ
jgi:hypothetical protein